jgi:hypothetical protein
VATKIHYAHSTTVRWRVGRWLNEHGARWAVCMNGPESPHVSDQRGNVTHDRRAVTCKRCLGILERIDAYARDPAPMTVV